MKPDKIAVTADDLGMKRRNYELTWESAPAGTITVTQKLTVQLSRNAVLQTAAKLPYPKEVATTYAGSLASTKDINVGNPALDDVGNRGFKSLDCLLTTGWAIRVGDGTRDQWIDGNFLTTSDASPYKEDNHCKNRLRAAPTNNDVLGAAVLHAKPSAQTKVRRLPINSLIMDLTVPPGTRDYSSDDPSSSTRPAYETSSSRPAEK